MLLALGGCAPAPPSAPSANVAPSTPLLPARLRRLSNVEYERSVAALLGARYALVARLPPDVRPGGYTRNAELGIAPAAGPRLLALAEELAADAVQRRLRWLAPCHTTAPANDAAGAARTRDVVPTSGAGAAGAADDDVDCVSRSIDELGRRAYRRPLDEAEQSALHGVFAEGARDRGFEGGLELLLATLLTSPGLWYVSEGLERAAAPSATPGARDEDCCVKLGPYEAASALSYTLTGAPPDEELLRAAAAGELDAGRARGRQARRLLGKSDTRFHFRQFVLEWLEVDGLGETAKDAEAFPRYDALKPHMLAETEAFVDEVMVHDGGRFSVLLGGGFSALDEPLARFYGLGAYGPRVDLAGSGRLGLLQHASFLAAHAHPDSTSPVKRGDFVLRQMLCVRLPRPSELDIEVTIPPPDPRLTTRERFAAHTASPSCRGCHRSIDALGFSFEDFGPDGARRASDNDKPVDTRVDFALGARRARLEDSRALSRWLAQSGEARRCFARQALRYFSASHEPAFEEHALASIDALGPERQDSLIEILIAFVESEAFIWRKRAEERPT